MEFTVTDVLIILIFFQSGLFSFYLLSLGKSKQISNRLIASFIFLLGINVFDSILSKSLYLDFPQIAFIIISTASLIAPLMFLYIKSVAYKNFEFGKSDFLHFLLFVIIIALSFYMYHDGHSEDKAQILKKLSLELSLADTIFVLLLHLQTLFYFVASYRVISRYKQIVKENFSDADKINLSWLREIIFAFAIIVSLSSIETVVQYYTNHRNSFNTLPLIFTVYLFFVNWIIYKALKLPQIFTGVDSGIQLVREFKKEEAIPGRRETLILEGPTAEFLKNLTDLMDDEKLYRDSTLNIQQLADSLDVSLRDLSLLINNELKQNFFDFINQYRINEAKEILMNPDNKKLTVLEIMYDVGFNSKSSFNTAFKKNTKQTPTDYRRNFLK